ncbi:MAG: SycD/LcrH family type III secretion system chaperone [Waddliaceae bacterium]
MRRDQKEQVKQAAKKVGKDVSQQHGNKMEKMTQDALVKGVMPQNLLGMSDAMVEGLYSQAYRLYNTGKYKDASQLFRMLVMINSTEAKYSMGLAACFHMMKEYNSAITTYALCGIIDPKSPIPHYHASDCYMQMKDPISAIISLEMAVKRAGEKPEYQSLKDRALMSIKNLKEDMDLSKVSEKILKGEKEKRKAKKKK